MHNLAELPEPTIYRNFNICPHCISLGGEGLLVRIREGMPMISRSDGSNFHLLLVDRPVPFPAERAAGRTKSVSICFWYSHVANGGATLTSIVVVPEMRRRRGAFFRTVEVVADLLTEKLGYYSQLSTLYEFQSGKLSGFRADELVATEGLAQLAYTEENRSILKRDRESVF